MSDVMDPNIPRTVSAERSPWRWIGAAAAVVMVAAHVPITGAHLSEAPYIGWLFLILEALGIALAVALTLADSAVVWRWAALVPAAALPAYVLSRSVGLPLIGDDVGNWTEPLGVVAVSAETLLLLVALSHRMLTTRFRGLTDHAPALGWLVLVAGMTATLYASQHGEGAHAAATMPAMPGMRAGHDMRSMVAELPPFEWSSFRQHWDASPWWLLFSALALTWYLSAWTLARRNGVAWVPPWRVLSFVAGIAVLLLTVSSAIDSYAMAIFWDHMVEHLLLIMVVPALLVLGHPLTVARSVGTVCGTEQEVDRILRSGPVTVLTHPFVGLALYTSVIVGTHLTGFMDAMSTHGWLIQAEQWLYVVTGYLFLLPLIGAEPLRARLPFLGRILLLLVAMLPDTVVGIVLMQTDGNTLPVMEAQHPAWAPSPVSDLHIAGALMWVAGDGLMMLFGVGVTIAMITHTGTNLVVGQRLESIRRRTMIDNLASVGAAGALTAKEDAETTVIDVDEDDDMLDAYNRMLARLNGGEHPHDTGVS